MKTERRTDSERVSSSHAALEAYRLGHRGDYEGRPDRPAGEAIVRAPWTVGDDISVRVIGAGPPALH